jgi:hypothetical protein
MIASWLGSRTVFIVAPPLIVAAVVWLVRYSYRATRAEEPTRLEALQDLFQTSDETP